MSDSNPLLSNATIQGAAKHIEGLLDSKGVISKSQKEEAPVEQKEPKAKAEDNQEVQQQPEAQPQEDKFATSLMFSAIIFGLCLAPIDIFHLNFSPAFEGLTKNIGLGIYTLGMILFMASINANEFAETTVNIQEERGQKVIDTGVYSLVRHPMYTGFIFFITGVNLWLGTYLSLLLSLTFLAIALRSRINIEEKTLLNDLEGYDDYCKKVKARLIPFLF